MVTIINELPDGWEDSVNEFCVRTAAAADNLKAECAIQCIELYEEAGAFVALVHAKLRKQVPTAFMAELQKLVVTQHNFLQHVCQECGDYGAQHTFPDEHDQILCDHCAEKMTVNQYRKPRNVGRAAKNVVKLPNPHDHVAKDAINAFMSYVDEASYVDTLKAVNEIDWLEIFEGLHPLHARRQVSLLRLELYARIRAYHENKESGQI